MSTKNSEHLQFIHDRLVFVHDENVNYDYMHRLRKIIGEIAEVDESVIITEDGCNHNWCMIGHQGNGHYYCDKCKKTKDL